MANELTYKMSSKWREDRYADFNGSVQLQTLATYKVWVNDEQVKRQWLICVNRFTMLFACFSFWSRARTIRIHHHSPHQTARRRLPLRRQTTAFANYSSLESVQRWHLRSCFIIRLVCYLIISWDFLRCVFTSKSIFVSYVMCMGMGKWLKEHLENLDMRNIKDRLK